MTEQLVALVTGGSRGIGAAIARRMAASQYRVALVAKSRVLLDTVAGEITSAGGSALAIPGDLANLEFAHEAVDRTIAAFGRIDVLVNNAAARELVSMRRISVASWKNTLRICLTAPAFLARWAAADMERRRRGVIINVSSMMARQAAGISPAYVACKAGLDALTIELASLYGPSGIRVVGLAPGAIDTDLSRDLSERSHDRDEIRQFSEDMIMLGRWGAPEEIAHIVQFLASDEASYISGTTLVADGGWLHQHLPLSLKRRHYADEYP
jgi:3-oxoacyl-[acyl-carrier protein] reductase